MEKSERQSIEPEKAANPGDKQGGRSDAIGMVSRELAAKWIRNLRKEKSGMGMQPPVEIESEPDNPAELIP